MYQVVTKVVHPVHPKKANSVLYVRDYIFMRVCAHMYFSHIRVDHLRILLCISYLHFCRVDQMIGHVYYLLYVYLLVVGPVYYLGWTHYIYSWTRLLLDYHLAALWVLAREIMGWSGTSKWYSYLI